jgi:hypothetical protein
MNADSNRQEGSQEQGHTGGGMSYWRFAAMIATAVVVMYGVMYIDTYAFDHITFSESRVFMALTMGGTMALVMFAWMSNMYRNAMANIALVVGAIVFLAVTITLDRTQLTIGDKGFMSSMIPHHSMAILRAEAAGISDVRVCELAVAISEAQHREIAEMKWLIADIEANGGSAPAPKAEERPVPSFPASAERECPGA